MKTKEHFFISRTGTIFILSKLGDKWYLTGPPERKDSKMLWPIASTTNYFKLKQYVKREMGLLELV